MDSNELTVAGKRRFNQYIIRNPDGTAFIPPKDGGEYTVKLVAVELHLNDPTLWYFEVVPDE